MASTATPSPVGSFITTKRIELSSSSSSSFSSSVMMIRTHLLSSSPVPLFLRKKQSAVFQSTASTTQWKSRRSFRTVVFATTAEETSEKKEKRYPGEGKGFVEEMRFVAMKLHTKDQAKEGEREAEAVKPIGKLEPSIDGYLKFLVDSKVVFDSLESIVQMAAHPWYSEFKNTGLERSEKLAKDLEWFKEQGHTIPEPSSPGKNYASYMVELSENDPQAFICHFYNVYFAHSAGGRMIGRKVAEKILDGRELEFYKWDGDLSELLQNVRDKINRIANSWSREEKNHCLEQTEMSFKWSGEILRLVLT